MPMDTGVKFNLAKQRLDYDTYPIGIIDTYRSASYPITLENNYTNRFFDRSKNQQFADRCFQCVEKKLSSRQDGNVKSNMLLKEPSQLKKITLE